MSFAEPNMLNPHVFAERKFKWLFPEVSPDETAFVRRTLRDQLRGLGFEDVAITRFDWLHPATPPALIPAISSMGRGFEAVWPIPEFAGSPGMQGRRGR
jgi:hypothetical protein